MECIEDVVEAACGKEAAKHQGTLERKFLKPFADEIDCKLGV